MLLLFTSTLLSLSLSPPPSLPNSSASQPPHHPDPDSVAASLISQISASARRLTAISSPSSCITGNPIDDCWRCGPAGWSANRERLADCAVGFGQEALGGKGGRLYVVTSNRDDDPADPRPGTLRHAVIQEEPLWITFSASTVIRLTEELIVNSYKTIDGRGVEVHITGGGCITLQHVSHVIIHNVHIHNCVPAGNTIVRSSPTHAGFRGRSDGDGISIYDSRKIWIDHCSLSRCTDGLIDVIMGSTGITISNSYFSHHDEVMLMGHRDEYEADSAMQVTIAFNRFGEALVQRMPRCRRGYFHIVNNDYSGWKLYAVGGSADPTINSQGNRYRAPRNADAKEVTKRVDTSKKEWSRWDWRSEGDIMENGAFFVPSGQMGATNYAKASSTRPKSAGMIDMLTMNAGVLGGFGSDGAGDTSYSSGNGGDIGIGSEANNGYLGMIYGGITGGSPPPSVAPSMCTILVTAVCSLSVTTLFTSLLSSAARDI